MMKKMIWAALPLLGLCAPAYAAPILSGSYGVSGTWTIPLFQPGLPPQTQQISRTGTVTFSGIIGGSFSVSDSIEEISCSAPAKTSGHTLTISCGYVNLSLLFADDLGGNIANAAFSTLVSGSYSSYIAAGYGSSSFSGGVTGGKLTLTGYSPTPEPASWALMIGGFAITGAALRRRSSMRPALVLSK